MKRSFTVVTNWVRNDNVTRLTWGISYYYHAVNGYVTIKDLLVTNNDLQLNSSPLSTDEFARVTISDKNTVLFQKTLDNHTRWSIVEKLPPKRYTIESYILIKILIFEPDNSVTQVVKNYNLLLESKKLTNVKFVIENQEISAHSEIISMQSPVFKSMFECDMLEKNNERVEITDTEPKIFKLLIDFIYHGKVESSDFEDSMRLLITSDKYFMTDLVRVCEKLLAQKLIDKNVVDLFVTACFLNSAEILKKHCMEFIYDHMHDVIVTESYRSMVKDHPELLSELFCHREPSDVENFKDGTVCYLKK